MTLLRQSFNDFLNSPGPSTPRSRGRGRGRGRGGGRGGGQSFGSGGGSSNLSKSDYSNVPFDYATINNQRYNKMDGYVQPFGPTSTDSPRGRGSQTPRGRGRGRGGFANTASSPGPDSGQSTPVRGLGHRGRGGGLGFRGKEASSSYKVTSTVGREGVTWGGRGAPLFVKAGELFKDGEVDVVKKSENDEIMVERLPLSDPSAPQMTDLADDIEVDIRSPDAVAELPVDSVPTATGHSDSTSPEIVNATGLNAMAANAGVGGSNTKSESLTDLSQAPNEIAGNEPTEQLAHDLAALSASGEAFESSMQVEEETTFYVDTNPETPAAIQVESTSTADSTRGASAAVVAGDTFFVDTAPDAQAVADPTPVYSSELNTVLGQQEERPSTPGDDEEEIVFAPRIYKQPEPITLDMPQASSSKPSRRRSSPPVVSRTFIKPLSRAQKKALKKDKKMSAGKGKKSKRAKRQAELAETSEVEWGSDGPPGGGDEIIAVEGADDSTGEDDVAVLRDYLAGTLLNERPVQVEKVGDEEEEEEEEEEEAEDLDSDEVDEAIEMDMMRQFGEGARQWNANGSVYSEDSDEHDDDSRASDGSSDGSEEDDEDYDIDVEIASGSGDSDGSESDGGDGTEDDIDRQLALALDQGEEDSEMEELFTGKAGWGNDTDWFIQSMEDALDSKAMTFKNKKAKSQSKLFHAIENGNFDDLDLPTELVKKNKNKHVPAELQAQWEKDRLAKAEKKRQRALDRLIAEIDPYPAARTKKGKMKTKGKGKGKGKDTVTAASLAHLIPASASEVAEMFDISSGEEADPAGLGPARPRKGVGLLPDITESWMKQLNDQIRDFLEDDGKQTFSLPPMDAEGRKKIHMLAECYGLGSKSRGGGRARFTILIKKARSGQAINHDQVERLIEASTFSGGMFYKNFFGGGGAKLKGKKADKSGKGGKAGPSRQPMPSLRARDGEQVGGGADKIGIDNIGHQLLSKMGWAEGDRIGRTGGLDAPIVAIVKNTKSGLGA